MNIKWVKLTEIFEIISKQGVTQDWIKLNPGIYPVYSSKTTQEGIVGYCNQHQFDGEYLTWTKDGVNAGTVFYRNGKFNIAIGCGVLKNRNPLKFNSKFYLHWLNKCFHLFKTGDTIPHVTTKTLKGLSIPLIPIEQQNRIASVLDTIAELKAELKAELRARDKQNKYYQEHLLSEESLSGKLWGFKEEIIKYVKLSEIFEIISKHGVTKDYIKNNPGNYPVYSSKTFDEGIIGYSNTYDFNGEYLTWTKDGNAGTVFYRNGKFSVSDGCGVLKNKDQSRFNTKFYHHYLNKLLPILKSGTTVPHVTIGTVKKVLLPLPSLKIQNKIVAIMDKLESLINSVNGDIPVEISTREDQYKYYSELLLSY